MRLAQGACCSKTTPLASSLTASSHPTQTRTSWPMVLTEGTAITTGVQAAAMTPRKVGISFLARLPVGTPCARQTLLIYDA